MKRDDVAGHEEPRFYDDDICCFEGGFLVDCVRRAWVAETPCPELVWSGIDAWGFVPGALLMSLPTAASEQYEL